MAITPYIEAPFNRTTPQPDSGGIDTSSWDYLRQGVSIRTPREQYAGMFPKFLPASQQTPNGEGDSTVFGQPKAFRSDVPFQDLQKFNAVEFIQSGSQGQIYPQILRNASLINPYQLDGAIEPLLIREAVSMMSVEGTNHAHSIKGSLQDANIDERGKASQLVQIYDYRVPLVTKPFIDFPEYMGDKPNTSVILPGVISAAEAVMRPFVDMSFMHRLTYDSPILEGASDTGDVVAFVENLSISFDVMLGAHQVSATAGFVYDNNPMGTDSLAFGGWKK